MSGEIAWLWILLGTGLAFLAWAWRRIDARGLAARDGSPREEPCWTEPISSDGRLSYGRQGCFHAGLAEMEARVRAGEFGTPC